MSDFTTDQLGTPTRRSRSAPPMREYYTFFALIFLATLPLACLTWALRALRRLELPERGPIRAAWAQAQIITPQIFSA